MKKILLLFSLVFLSICGLAQPVSFGIRGGITWANQRIGNATPYFQINTSPITTVSVGGFADIRRGSFSLQPGIFLSGQGSEAKLRYTPPVADQPFFTTADGKSKLWYLEIPVDIVYHMPVPFNNIYVGAGPSLSMGITGRLSDIEYTVYPDNPAQNRQTSFAQNATFGPNGYRRFFLGGNAIAGIKLKNKLLFNLGYDLGLTQINHSNPGYAGNKDDEFTISVGYCFK